MANECQPPCDESRAPPRRQSSLASEPPPDPREQPDMTWEQFWRAVTAEFCAMFFFVFICVGCALTTTGVAEGASEMAAGTATLAISLCFGLTIFVLVHIFGHISGAHINPAVTLSLAIARLVPVKQAISYVIAQCLGSIVASGCLMVVMGLDTETMGGYNALTGPENNKVLRGFLTELILTTFLCLAVFATIDPATNDGAKEGPLAIGMAVAIAHLIAVPITGCGINPARSLGPALFSDAEAAAEDLWVFLIAPLVGAGIVAWIYPLWWAEENFSGNLRGAFHSKEVDEVQDLQNSELAMNSRPSPKEFNAQVDELEDHHYVEHAMHSRPSPKEFNTQVQSMGDQIQTRFHAPKMVKGAGVFEDDSDIDGGEDFRQIILTGLHEHNNRGGAGSIVRGTPAGIYGCE